MSANDSAVFAITTYAATLFEFQQTASVTASGVSSEFQVVIGPNGVGTDKARNTAPKATACLSSFIFPVQVHPIPALAGTWSYLQIRHDPMDVIFNRTPS